MRFFSFSSVLLLLILSYNTWAQTDVKAKQPRILILLDGSSSMLQPWVQHEKRFNAAGKIITTLIDSIYKVNDQVEFALRVYGHQHPSQENNCFDTKREVMFSKDNLAQMSLRLESLHPLGVSPIAYSLKEAAENDMQDSKNYNYSLILITDGGESCGGNICDVVKNLLDKKINFRPYILSLVDYAPLKGQYDCLGEYLLITNAKDIPPAVETIVKAYRPMLTLTPAQQKIIQTAVVTPPSVLKVDVPKFKVSTPAEEPVKATPPPPKPNEPVIETLPKIITPPPAKDLTTETNIKVETTLPKTEISQLRLAKARNLSQIFYTPPLALVSVPRSPVYVVKEEVPIPEKKNPEVTKPMPALAAPEKKPPVVAKPKPPVKATMPKPVDAKYTVEREEAKETTLEIYFTDGKGKFYQTTPQVFLNDPKSGQQVHKFFRTVDPNGNPDPLKNIPTGTYDLTINKSTMIVRNIEIKPNTKNKYLIQVSKGSILFAYQGNAKRPVAEYEAIVNRRFAAGPTIRQQCTQQLEYEPGTYYVEVNTKPVHKVSLDMNFGEVYVVNIPEDGFLNITNTSAVGKVDFYCPLGDVFVKFYQENVGGSAEGQKVTLQPGTYQARFKKNPNMPYAEETILKFNIRSNTTTNLLLE